MLINYNLNGRKNGMPQLEWARLKIFTIDNDIPLPFFFTRKDGRIKWVPLWKICCQDTVIFILIMGREREDSVDRVCVALWGADWQLLQKTWVTLIFFFFFFFLVEGVGRGNERPGTLCSLGWFQSACTWGFLWISDSPIFYLFRSLGLSFFSFKCNILLPTWVF